MFKRNPAAPPPYLGPPTFTTTVGHVERAPQRAGNPSTTEDLTRQFDFKPGRRIVASDRDYVVGEDGSLRRTSTGQSRALVKKQARKDSKVSTARIEVALARRGEKRAKRKLRRVLGEAKRLQAETARLLESVKLQETPQPYAEEVARG